MEAWILCDLFEAMRQVRDSRKTAQDSLSGSCVTTETLSLCLIIIHMFTTMYALSRIQKSFPTYLFSSLSSWLVCIENSDCGGDFWARVKDSLTIKLKEERYDLVQLLKESMGLLLLLVFCLFLSHVSWESIVVARICNRGVTLPHGKEEKKKKRDWGGGQDKI